MTNKDVTPTGPTDKDIIETLRSQLAAERTAHLEHKARADKNETAVKISGAQLQQYTANANVLKEQRDEFLEDFTNALVNLRVLQERHNLELADKDREILTVSSSDEGLQASFTQLQESHKEVLQKFGILQHKRKVAEAALEDSESSIQEYEDAFQWFKTNGIPKTLKTFEDGASKPMTLKIMRDLHHALSDKCFSSASAFVNALIATDKAGTKKGK